MSTDAGVLAQKNLDGDRETGEGEAGDASASGRISRRAVKPNKKGRRSAAPAPISFSGYRQAEHPKECSGRKPGA